jgi:CelD/BcsL family acetyltransferase involved in cellulose biosynthesis
MLLDRLSTKVALQSSSESEVTIDCIQTKAAFDQLEQDWRSIHRQDQHSTVFSDWDWLRNYCELTSDKLWILAVRVSSHNIPSPSPSYVGFLALKIRSIKYLGVTVERCLETLGGEAADYASFVCLPEYEKQVTEACADYIVAHPVWDSMILEDVLDPRLETFIERIRMIAPQLNPQIIQGAICPWVPLPEDLETYLMKTLKRKSRNKVRGYLKKLDSEDSSEGSLCSVIADESNFDENLNHFFQFHSSQWDIYTAQNQAQYADFYRKCFKAGILKLFMLYQDHQPIAADLLFFDAKHKNLGAYGGSYLPEFAHLSPGHVNLCAVLKFSLEQGFTSFDFLRGDEGYKSMFGAEERWTQDALILRSRVSQWRYQLLIKARKSERVKKLRDRLLSLRRLVLSSK